jgi:hypothetical protein
VLTRGELCETIEAILWVLRGAPDEAIRDRRAQFNKVFTTETFYYILPRVCGVRSKEVRPINEKRTEVMDDAIQDYFGTLFATVSGVCFIFTTDEMGDAQKTMYSFQQSSWIWLSIIPRHRPGNTLY